MRKTTTTKPIDVDTEKELEQELKKKETNSVRRKK